MPELLDGSTAIARGALDAGCSFFAGYPITPASSILALLMKELPKVGGVAIQGEDEIASIGMCLGAAMTGARAMTATSGPGISLYGENLGLAVMGEVPLVVVDVQRLGPATGGATTVAQGDVQMVRWGTSGGYPVIVLAPASIADCYALTRDAFALAQRFRCPVFLLADKELAMTRNTVAETLGGGYGGAPEAPAWAGRPAEPGEVDDRPYRYRPPDGVPALRPFGGGTTVRFTGSSHDERGLITKDPATLDALDRHLAAKVEEHRDEIERVVADPESGARTLVVAYGVTAGALRAAVARHRRGGGKVSALTVQSLWPVPETAFAAVLEGIERVVVAELNLGQYRREVERLAGGREVVGVHRIDGELIRPEEILEVIR